MEQKDLFQSMIRKELSGPSPVPFPVIDFDARAVETTPEGRLISEEEFWEGLVFYRGERYTYRFPPRPERKFPEVDYAVVRVNSARDDLWSLRDHPRLALDVLNMKRALYPWVATRLDEARRSEYETPFSHGVDEEEMRSFLDTYGPLTPSYVPLTERVPEAMIDELQMYMGDHRTSDLACLFSVPLTYLHGVARRAREDPLEGIVSCFAAIERAPARTLYRALLLQFMGHLLSGNPVHRCEGCGRWFSFTEDETQARHREGWKRRDARYHSRACLKATSERRRRARLREQETA